MTISKLNNLSSGDLADELGALKAEAADLKARKDAIETELLARGESEAEGCLFRITVTPAGTRWTIDTPRIKSEMGDAWVIAHSKIGNVKATVNVAARTGATRRKAA